MVRNRIGCIGFAVLVLTLAACTGNDDERTRESCTEVGASCGTVPPSSSTSTSSSTPTSTSTSTTSTTSTSVTATVPPTTGAPQPIIRPTIDPTKCQPYAAAERPVAALDLHLFARPNKGPSTIQIIAGPGRGPAGAFALVQRYADQAGPVVGGTAVGDWHVATYANGNGVATWNLADGTQGYVRSRGMDGDELSRIVRGLQPRDAGAPIPGFDYTPQDGDALAVQAEHLSTGVQGGWNTMVCQVPSTRIVYRIDALFGDPVYQYALVIDRPSPLDVGFANGTLVTIAGPEDASAPTVTDIVEADPDQWQALLHGDTQIPPFPAASSP